LEIHARETADPHPDCGRTREHLPAYLRGAATRRESGRVAAHLASCTPCSSLHAELAAVDDDLAGILGPLVLGTAAAEYLTTHKAGAFARHPGRAALAGVAAAVMLITGVALGLGGQADDPPAAEAPVHTSPTVQPQTTDGGDTLDPSASGEPDHEASPTAPGGPTASPTSVPPTDAPLTPPPSSGGTSDDPTTDPDGDFSGPSSPPSPPTTPPGTPPPPPGADPAVNADPPTSAGSFATIEVVVKDVAATDMRLTVEVKGSDVEVFLDRRCTPLDGLDLSVCDLSEDASAIKVTADLPEADGVTITFGITPRRGVEETPAQQENNSVAVTLPPLPSED
jgi:hypothetical protein